MTDTNKRDYPMQWGYFYDRGKMQLLKDWREFTESQYSHLTGKGYRFNVNCIPEFIEEIRRHYEDRGLEVVIGDKAFSPDSDFPLDPQVKAVFSRTKQKVAEQK